MRVLIACEFSGIVRQAFRARGHDAFSCDYLPAEDGCLLWHYQTDVRSLLHDDWDLMIAHPPCTHLSRAGARWWPQKRADGRQQQAIQFILQLATSPIPKIAIENPIGILSSAWRRADQTIQPWEYGDPWIKTTQLWLKNLPPLIPTNPVTPIGYWVSNGSLWRRRRDKRETTRDKTMILEGANKNDNTRSRFWRGIADAMAAQWG